MKNLLTTISQEEKKRILEMHSGMKKTIKEYDDRNGMNWVQNTTMDRPEPIDEPMFGEEEGSVISTLKKHNLLDEILHKGDNRIMIKDKSSEVVQRLLSILHLLTELKFLSIVDCESADFSDVDICGLPELAFVNLQGTENNFEEQGYKCAIKEKLDDDSYSFYYIS
jgi:hypothetical protein